MNSEHIRTLSIVRELAKGKTIELDGYTIGMGADMSIGAIMTNGSGQQSVAGLSTMDLAQFNALLTKNDIGMAVLSPNKAAA